MTGTSLAPLTGRQLTDFSDDPDYAIRLPDREPAKENDR